ncbi:MAG: alpha/beta hydrolase [Polyangiaceae bacterium]
MSFATAQDGTKIFYRDIGDPKASSTVVMIQGLGLSSQFWFDLPDRLVADPKASRRVIVLDNRGTGQSGRARPPYRMQRLADDVACVLEAANARPATVVGISMGGMISQHVAIRHPKLVRGLVLLATTAGLPHGRLASPRTLAKLFAIGFGRDRSGKMLAELLIPPSEMHRAREIFAAWPDLMKKSPPAVATFLGQLAAIVRHSTGFSLRKITVPTVVMTGELDTLVPPKNSHILARKISGARLEVLRNVGHAIPSIDADAVRRALEMIQA